MCTSVHQLTVAFRPVGPQNAAAWLADITRCGSACDVIPMSGLTGASSFPAACGHEFGRRRETVEGSHISPYAPAQRSRCYRDAERWLPQMRGGDDVPGAGIERSRRSC